MKTFANFTLLFFSILLTSCKESGTESISSSAPASLASSCNIGRWNNLSLPLQVKMSSEFNGDFTNVNLVAGLNPIEQMAKGWNDAVTPNATLFQLPFGATSTTGHSSLTNFRDNELGIYKSHTWFSNVSSNALAITQFYGVMRSDATLGDYIELTHADIIVNYRDFSSDISMTGNPLVEYDLPTIVLHEMGHFLGLCHENRATSIMAPYYLSTQRNLKTFDTNKIKALYLDNQNLSALKAKPSNKTQAITQPVGTEIKGIVELNANGHCRHFINGKLVYEHN
jgi:hypothetical protein